MWNKYYCKKVAALSMATLMPFLMAGCGNGGRNSEDGGALNITIWDTAQQDGLNQIVKEFTEETGIQASIQVVTWDQYWTLLEAGAQGGDMPDVFWMHSNEAQKYMANGILLDLTDYIANSDKLEMDQYPQELKDFYTYDGKTYAIPKDRDTIALWYNKTMFDEAGLEYPNEDWTWDDYYEAAKKLTKEDGTQYGTAMNPSGTQDGWYNIVYSMGGSVISDDHKTSMMDSPETIEAMNYVDKLVKECMPSPQVMSETALDVLFSSGKIAMLPMGSWMVGSFNQNDYIRENCDVAVLPKDAETGKRVSIYNGLGWAANANTSNPEGAKKLIEWFGTKEMQQKQAELGVTMAAYDGVSESWKNYTDAFNIQAYLDMLDNSELVFRPATYSTVTWENQIGEDLKAAWNGESTMEEACKKAAQDMNEILAEEQ